MLADGWRMGTSNPIPNSILNLPVQGTASVILRKACRMLDSQGFDIRATMHDAITILCDEGTEVETATKASEIMMQAATEVLGQAGMKVGAVEYVRHGEIWTHSDKGQKAWDSYKQWII